MSFITIEKWKRCLKFRMQTKIFPHFPQSSSAFDIVRYGICARKFRVIVSSSKAAYRGRSVVRVVNEVLCVGWLAIFIVRSSVRFVKSAHGKLCVNKSTLTCVPWNYVINWQWRRARLTLGTESQIAAFTRSCVLNIISVLRGSHCACTLAWFVASDIWMLSKVKNLFVGVRCHMYKYCNEDGRFPAGKQTCHQR